MKTDSYTNFDFFDAPSVLYNAMLEDIKVANIYIYLETYKFGSNIIGKRFRDALLKKAQQGVEVKVLIDSWGSTVNESFFNELLKLGGEVVFFKKIKFGLNVFLKNHMRNHRKLLIIDDKISYIGSANISTHAIKWRESVLKLESKIAFVFKKIFLEDFLISKNIFPNRRRFTRTLHFRDFDIIRDTPSTIYQSTRKKFLKLIKEAQKEIVIETAYFLPDGTVRKALINAAKNGVIVSIITPKHSDVVLFDILRNKYLGTFYKNNIHIYLYRPQNLHAKLMIIDNEIFSIGSSNFDYRSFRFQHELNLIGKDKTIIDTLNAHIEKSKAGCFPFNYELWKNRPKIQKFIEWLLVPIRHFF